MEIVTVRPYEKGDLPFIFSCWRNAVWFDTRKTDMTEDFYHQKTREIKKDIEGATINVASLKSDPDFLVGYAVIKYNIVEFVYVKLDYRKQGIASILCKGYDIGHPVTKIGAAIVRRMKENR